MAYLLIHTISKGSGYTITTINDMFRYSKLISMVNNRLHIAKSLLKKDGVLI